jgi:hypothetical protein
MTLAFVSRLVLLPPIYLLQKVIIYQAFEEEKEEKEYL